LVNSPDNSPSRPRVAEVPGAASLTFAAEFSKHDVVEF
jgi:hypothetical protein